MNGADLQSEPRRFGVLGVCLTAIEPAEAVERVILAACDSQPFGVSALAVHGVMTAVQDSSFQYQLNALEMVVPDGQPVRWALKWLHGIRLDERVYGPDLMYETCRRAAEEGLPIFLYGSTSDTLERLSDRLTTDFPNLKIAGTQPSRFRAANEEEREADLRMIAGSGARIVYIGLGCPRQEIWAFENRLALEMPALAVGAAFDYWAGQLRRPPSWMQRRGLEWLYRLVQEPRRLWRRYILLNPAYLALILAQRLGLKVIPTSRGVPPQRMVRPG